MAVIGTLAGCVKKVVRFNDVLNTLHYFRRYFIVLSFSLVNCWFKQYFIQIICMLTNFSMLIYSGSDSKL